jgi:hypothetical protein
VPSEVPPPACGGRGDDDGVVEELGDRELGPASQRMIPRQAGHPVLGVEDEHPVFRQIHRRPDDRHLGGAVGQARRRISEVEFPWLQGDFRIGGFEVPHQPEQQVSTGADQIAQPDPAVVRGQVDQVVDRGVDPAQGVANLRHPGLAEFGQRHFTSGAGEQHDTELMLKLLIAVDRAGCVMNSLSAARR